MLSFLEIKPAQSNKGYLENTGDYFNCYQSKIKDYPQWNKTLWDSAVEESSLAYNTKWRAAYLRTYLKSFNGVSFSRYKLHFSYAW